jgi:hypothetical protein
MSSHSEFAHSCPVRHLAGDVLAQPREEVAGGAGTDGD